MNVKPRALGAAVVYLAVALAAAALAQAVLTVRAGGRFPWELGPVATMAFGPFVLGVLISVHYWRSSEFQPRRIILWPLLSLLLMAGVMVATSPFIERPQPRLAPSVTRESIPALPPAKAPPTPKAGTYELIGTDTYLVAELGRAETLQGKGSDRDEREVRA